MDYRHKGGNDGIRFFCSNRDKQDTYGEVDMPLTEKQKEINSDPLYWKWFEKWWAEDFSYQAVLDRSIIPDNELHCFTKMNFHRRTVDTHPINFAERDWHPMHLPEHDLAGNVAEEALILRARKSLEISRGITDISGVIRPDFNLNRKEIKSYNWCVVHSNLDRINNVNFQNCLINISVLRQENYLNCCFLKERITPQTALNLKGCHFQKTVEMSALKTNSIIIDKAKNIESLKLLNPNIVEIRHSFIKNIEIESSRDFKAILRLQNTSASINLLSIDNQMVGVDLNLKGKTKYDLHFDGVKVNRFNAKFDENNFESVGSLSSINTIFDSPINFSGVLIDNIKHLNSSFVNGLKVTNCTIDGGCEFLGVKIFKSASFDESHFKNGFVYVPDRTDENKSSDSIIHNASFEGATFVDIEKNRKSCSVNFNDTIFQGSASFNKSIFDGVPKFHGCVMHSETSFMDLGQIPDIDGEDIEKPDVYSSYQSAFRALRQHMEKNQSTATAFEFGRREMIAKQRRTNSVDVPKSEIFFTKLYGCVANYGQDFIKPLKLLAAVWLASIAIQLLIFMSTASNCILGQKNCSINWELAGEAFERSMIFSLPPFTLLMNRSIDSKTSPDTCLLTDILSGGFMIVHAIAASTLVFLFLLGVRRRMQIK